MRVLWAIPWSRVINNIYQQQIAFVSVRRRRPSAREATPSDGNSLKPATTEKLAPNVGPMAGGRDIPTAVTSGLAARRPTAKLYENRFVSAK